MTEMASKRRFLKVASLAVSSSGFLAACATLGLPKIAKAKAGYVEPAKGARHCADCVHFEKPGGCTIVEGRIDPHAVCDYYFARA